MCSKKLNVFNIYFVFSSAVPVKKVENVVTCEVCKVAMQYLESLLKENTTEAEVKKALDGLCAYLPEIKTEVHIHLAGYSIFTVKHWLKHNVVPGVVSDCNIEITIQYPENNW